MLRGPLGNNNYKPKFSGHDTFPFRFTWLPKLVNYIEDGKSKIIKESEKKKLETITDFGVGLNMVKSIKHWSIATKVCDKEFQLTDFGKLLFSRNAHFSRPDFFKSFPKKRSKFFNRPVLKPID